MDASQSIALSQSPLAVSEHAGPHPATHHQDRPEEVDQSDETSIQTLAWLQTKKQHWMWEQVDDVGQQPQLQLLLQLVLPPDIVHADAEVDGTSAGQSAVLDGDLVAKPRRFLGVAAVGPLDPSRDPRGSCDEPGSDPGVVYVDGLQIDPWEALQPVRPNHLLHRDKPLEHASDPGEREGDGADVE